MSSRTPIFPSPPVNSLCLSVVLALTLLSPRPAAAQLTEPLSSCSIDGIEEPARCGSLRLAEDPERPDGRQIDVRITVLPRGDEASDATPLAVFAGGPGQAARDLATFASRAFAGIRDQRDILLVDARGTGGSHPLDCPSFASPTGPAAYMGSFFDLDRVRRCRRALEEKADLSLYTTTRIADDMVRVWNALGHEQVDVYGTSYGSRVALEIMRRHPDRLRSVILKGVAPMELRMPLNYPRDGQRSLDRILEHCRAEADCAAAYPELEIELIEVLEALDEGVEVELAHPATGERETVRVHRGPVVQGLMGGLQNPAVGTFIPRLIHTAAEGGWEPLTSFALFYRVTLVDVLHEGMFLSVTCAEDLPFIDPKEAALVAEDTFLGLSRYQEQAAACEIWDVPAADPGFREPVTGSVPTLLISGNYDSVTPPRWGRKVADRIEGAHHVVVPEGSHSFAGMAGCVDRIMADFIDTATPPETTPACVQDIRIGTFSLPGDPWPPMLQAPSGSGESR